MSSVAKHLKHLQIAVKQYVAPSLVLAALGVGCASNTKPADKSLSATLRTNSAVTEIAPTPPASGYLPSYSSTPAYNAATYTPAYASATPVSALPADAGTVGTATPAAAISTAAAGSTSTYTVQHGDTLFKIARDHYGDAKAWKKIAAANPAISGGVIKTGQRLVLP